MPNKIFITGDTHGFTDGNQLNSDAFPEGKHLTKDDYVIVCGDFGFIWNSEEIATENYWLKWFAEKPWTTLFVDGNHENHERLNAMPVKKWHGGNVHMLNDSVIHLMRGQVYTINDKKFFTFGGALSIDKEWRIEGQSWWRQELPSYSEETNGLLELEKHDNKVDFIITHTAPSEICQMMLWNKGKTKDPMAVFLTEVAKVAEYEKWYFGHFHENKQLGKFQCLYKNVERLM